LTNIGESNVTTLLECIFIDACLLYNRSRPTIAKHLWILSKLLTMIYSSTQSLDPTIWHPDPSHLEHSAERLLRYIIATCHMKMIHRLENQLSKTYIQSLSQVKTFPFDESSTVSQADEAIENDWQFLLAFMLPAEVCGLCYGVKRGAARRYETSQNPQTPTPNLTPTKNN
jgi:hypothetical protein